MAEFNDLVERSAMRLHFIKANIAYYGQKHFLRLFVKLSTALFVRLLEIHPYANGNGHIARLWINTIAGSFDLWLGKFPVHQRPFPNYHVLIKQYRDGISLSLEQFVANCIAAGQKSEPQS